MSNTQTQDVQTLLAEIASLKAALAAKPKSAPTIAPTTKLLDLPMGYHRAKVLRNVGWMNLPLSASTTVEQYQAAAAEYIKAHPKKPKVA